MILGPGGIQFGFVIIWVIDKIGRLRSESDLSIMNMITDRIGQDKDLLPINHNS